MLFIILNAILLRVFIELISKIIVAIIDFIVPIPIYPSYLVLSLKIFKKK